MLVPLEIPAGVRKVGTGLQAAGRWIDANLVRWREGSLRPVGGWKDFCTLDETPRGSFNWTDNSGTIWYAAGTYAGLYSIGESGVVTDITPVGYTGGRETGGEEGYGTWFYGLGDYGETEGGDVVGLPATTWAFDSWGENLIACADTDGKIYEWDTTGVAAVVTNAPTGCQSVMVTDERFVLALGADNDRRKVQWCDQEANTVWTPSATNQAGDIRLETSGGIMQGMRTRGQALILTSVDAHVASYVGQPFIYGFERVGDGCGVISKRAGAVFPSGAMWMGRDQFYLFDGSGVRPLPCEVADFVYDDLNRGQESIVFAVANTPHDEVWWFFPAGDATENNRYVAYNYRENHWLSGYLSRSTGVSRGVGQYPVWFEPGGAGYQHETGVQYGTLEPYAESGPVSMGAGDEAYMVRRCIPDDGTTGAAQLTIKARRYPDAAETTQGPFDISEKVSFRISGRQMRLRVSGVDGASWRWGIPRFDVMPRGQR